MTDIDANAIRLRQWQASVDARFAALELPQLGAAGGAGAASWRRAHLPGMSEADKLAIETVATLEAKVADLETRLEAIEVKANTPSEPLTAVEPVSGEPPPSPSPPVEPASATSPTAPGG
jgi:hypothetical protein